MPYRLLFLLYCFCLSDLDAQRTAAAGDWKQLNSDEQIEVFARDKEGSAYRELRIELEVDAPLAHIVALSAAAGRYRDWVYRCSEAGAVEQDSSRLLYYARIDVPWPLDDRDLYAEVTGHYLPGGRSYRSVTRALPRTAPEGEGIVRLHTYNCTSTYTALPDNPDRTRIVYVVHSEPRGKVPPWAANLFIDKGPVASMKRFRALCEE